jgi:uncharacterized protein YecE (DUF72 family)
VTQFGVVEVQQTFYQPPKVETARRWRQEAPQSFEFTLKAWQLITHEPLSPTYRRLSRPLTAAERLQAGAFKTTALVRRAWEETLLIAKTLNASLVVFQCPAKFTPHPEHQGNLRRFFGDLDRHGLNLAWEPRGPWPREAVSRLCQDLHLVPVVDPFSTPPYPGPLAYFRLHGRTGYRYRFTDRDLDELAKMSRDREAVYVMFNNMSMWEDAIRFQHLTARA